MQLTAPVAGEPVRRRLMAATCALLSAAAARTQASGLYDQTLDVLGAWNVDSSLAYYHENGRIQAIEPIVSVNKSFADASSLQLTGVFDSLSGSSPNGALASNRPQTFTSPSGKSFTGRHVYTVVPGALPVDPSYQDERVALSANWRTPITRLLEGNVGTKLSYEDDFVSVTLDASLDRDFNQKNTTVSLGVTDEYDWIDPIGGTPVARSDYELLEKSGHVHKNGAGLLLGLTQVMTRAWLAELNLSVDRFEGYLTDPYKIVSVINAADSATTYEYENRPDQRVRKSIYLENRVAGNLWSAGATLRYMADDWRIHSTTAQLNAHWWFGDHQRYLEPSFRWYRQSAAFFYAPYLQGASAATTEYASSDFRLSQFHAMTWGLKFAQLFDLRPDRPPSELSIRLEYYRQTIDSSFATPPGLQGLDLYPDLDAVLVQIGWRF